MSARRSSCPSSLMASKIVSKLGSTYPDVFGCVSPPTKAPTGVLVAETWNSIAGQMCRKQERGIPASRSPSLAKALVPGPPLGWNLSKRDDLSYGDTLYLSTKTLIAPCFISRIRMAEAMRRHP